MYSRAFSLNQSRVWVAKSFYAGRPIEGSIWQSTNGGTSWSQLNTAIMPDTNTSVEYHDMKFRATGLGFAIGRVRRASTGIETMFIQRTTDFGTSWSVVEYPTCWTSWLCPLSDSVWGVLALRNISGTSRIAQFRTTDAGATWQETSPGLPDMFAMYAGSIESLHTILVTNYNGWYRSTDGGLTYTPPTSDRDYWITDIAFERMPSSPSQQRAVAPATGTSCLLSTDGGLTWQPKRFPASYHYWGASGVRIVEGVMYVVLEQIALYKSTDLGQTWSNIFRPGYSAVRGFDAYDKNHLAVQTYGGLWTSSDGGTTWQSEPIPYNLWFNNQHIVEPFRTVGVGAYYDSTGARDAIFTTPDGGRNWRIEDFPGSLEQVAMISPSRGFVAGNRRLYRTTNGARSWEGVMQEVPRFCFYDSVQGVTKSVYNFYQTNDGGINWRRSQTIYAPDRAAGSWSMAASQRGDLFAVGDARFFRFASAFRPSGSNESPDAGTAQELALYQNSPNPFNPTTRITFRIPTLKPQTHVALKVYDVLGREVRTLVNEVLDSGFRSVEFDARDLPSGVYFYRLTADGRSITKKMILLR